MTLSTIKHYSVMLNESIEMLDIKKSGIYIDGTLGRGGHSIEILKKLEDGKLYVFDLDEDAIEESKVRLKDYSNVTYIHDNYKNMNKYVDKVDGILLDLGVSSPQFDEAQRGFSYRFDGPLDMRMNKDDHLTAYEVINTYSEKELSDIFWKYSEEKFSRKIASEIVKAREAKPISSTLELVEIIKKALPSKVLAKKGHPAKQVFQALRIEVNHELDSLKEFLDILENMLNENGKVVIITFHSLEDKMVKYKFKELSTVYDDLRIAKRPEEVEKPKYELINHKAIVASEKELNENNRSKSAKLRGLKRIWQD